MRFILRFIREEDGMGTVEIVIIIAVLVGLALIFRDAIITFATNVMQTLFANDQINSDIDVSNIREENGIQ
jgi:Flp pilus assembly pilin Flp